MVSDLALEWAVRAAMRRDDRTDDTAITIECAEGVVRLRGVVDDPEEAEAATEVAGAVEGARDVKNELRTASGGSRYRRD